MDLQIDEKVCPFCFEVIKKQARRCRYCHADFDAGALGPGSFDTQGAVQGITIGGSGHHIEGGVNITLGELDRLDEAKKKELLSLYQRQVREFPENAQFHYALGLSYLDLHHYDLSLSSLKTALARSPHHAELHYYLALANVGGKQPRTLPLAKIKEIETNLTTAIALDGSRGHFKILFAIVKYDYYACNGLATRPPLVEELLASVLDGELQREELRTMFEHVRLAPGALRTFLLNLLQ